MRHLALASLASLLCGTLLQLGTGCVITTEVDDVGNGNGAWGYGYFDVTWTLTEGARNVPIRGCVDGVTAEVVSVNLDTGETFVDLFDCGRGGATTAGVPAGDYDVWVDVRNSQDIVIAQSAVQRTSIFYDGELVPLDFWFPAGGHFYLTWQITNGLQPVACTDVRADGVSVLATLVGTDLATDDIFDCFKQEAWTPQLLLGDYIVSVNLLDGDQSLNEITTADWATLRHGNEVVDLGNFEFVAPRQ